MIVWYLKQIGNGFLMCDAGTETGACAVVLLEVLVVRSHVTLPISQGKHFLCASVQNPREPFLHGSIGG